MLTRMLLQDILWRQSLLLKGMVVALFCSIRHVLVIVMMIKGLALGFIPPLLCFDWTLSKRLDPYLSSPSVFQSGELWVLTLEE